MIFWPFLIEKMDILDHFLRDLWQPPVQRITISAFNPKDLRTPVLDPKMGPKVVKITKIWGSLHGFMGGRRPPAWRDLFWAFKTHTQDPQILVHLTKLVNFGPFCLSGVSENAILTLFWPPFEPSWAQNFTQAKCGSKYRAPMPFMDLGGEMTKLTPIWKFWPFWTPF